MKNRETTLSCIIPAFNEESSIENTLRAVRGLGEMIMEIVVVDDGSTDGTCRIVKKFPGVKLFAQGTNQGKSSAVARGIRESSGNYILLLDADLIGLTKESVAALIRPIQDSDADVVISMRENTPFWMKMGGLDLMSGERVLLRSFLLPHLAELEKLSGFGIEVFLNRLVIKEKLRLQSVMLKNVRNNLKFRKREPWRGIRDEALMWRDIFKTISFFEFISQVVRMRKLLI